MPTRRRLLSSGSSSGVPRSQRRGPRGLNEATTSGRVPSGVQSGPVPHREGPRVPSAAKRGPASRPLPALPRAPTPCNSLSPDATALPSLPTLQQRAPLPLQQAESHDFAQRPQITLGPTAGPNPRDGPRADPWSKL
ncbi:unnamed protein product [Lampetra fluviatilis]